MEREHKEYSVPFDDTIVAIATPTGNGAIGLVRISGALTLQVLGRFCRKIGSDKSFVEIEFEREPRHAFLCTILDENERPLDEAIVIFYRAPFSYTGEDSAEISMHGNQLLLRKFIGIAVKEPGIRPAEGGEFTRRAFLNGKLDLMQAEAVRQIIEAKSDFELNASRQLFDGSFSRQILSFRSSLLSLKAETEAEIDFVDEDITFQSKNKRKSDIENLIEEIAEILKRGETASRLSSGFRVTLIGISNSGKSSLLNCLLARDRAIVSEMPGTTRDYMAEEIEIAGVAVTLVDTAGIRKTENEIEIEGMRRTQKEIERSKIILHVIDGSLLPYRLENPVEAENMINVVNKKDIIHSDFQMSKLPEDVSAVQISCKTGEGIPKLKSIIKEFIMRGVGQADPILLEDRHRFHLQRIQNSLKGVISLQEEGAPAEIIATEIDNALDHLGNITGQISGEEVLGKIFSTFCVGK